MFFSVTTLVLTFLKNTFCTNKNITSLAMLHNKKILKFEVKFCAFCTNKWFRLLSNLDDV